MKKLSLFLFISLVGILQVFSQSNWTVRASIPTFGRQLGFAVSATNGMVYMGTGDAGVNGGNITDFWEYNPNTNSWTQKADFIGQGRRMASAYAIGDKIYVGLGAEFTGSYSLLNDMYEYDIATNTWSVKANFTGTPRRDATSFVIGGKGYICFGFDGLNFLNDIWEYDPVTDSWTQKADFPGDGRSTAVSFVIAREAYIGTGCGTSGYLNDLWAYDQITDTWEQKADLPGDGRRFASGFSIESFGYIGTGWNGSTDLKDYYEYNSDIDTWIQVQDLPGEIRDGSSGFTVGVRGFVGMGIHDGPDIYLADLYEFTPTRMLSVETNFNYNDIAIFPTVTESWLTVCSNNIIDNLKCSILNVNGVSFGVKIIHLSKQNNVKIDLSFLNTGRYFIVFENKEVRIIKSFIKL